HPTVWHNRLDKLSGDELDLLANRWQDNQQFTQLVATERNRRQVTVVAGTGQQEHGNDGDLAATSPLFCPWDIARDSASNLFFTNESHVRRIDAVTGRLSTPVWPGAYKHVPTPG